MWERGRSAHSTCRVCAALQLLAGQTRCVAARATVSCAARRASERRFVGARRRRHRRTGGRWCRDARFRPRQSASHRRSTNASRRRANESDPVRRRGSCAGRLAPLRARIVRRRLRVDSDTCARSPSEQASPLEVHLVFLRPMLDAGRVVPRVRPMQSALSIMRFSRFRRVQARQIVGSCRLDQKAAPAHGDEAEEEQQLHVLRAVARPEDVAGQPETLADSSEYRYLLRRQGCRQGSLLKVEAKPGTAGGWRLFGTERSSR